MSQSLGTFPATSFDNKLQELQQLQRYSSEFLSKNRKLLSNTDEFQTSDVSDGTNYEPMTTAQLVEEVEKWNEIYAKHNMSTDFIRQSLNKSDLLPFYFKHFVSEEAKRRRVGTGGVQAQAQNEQNVGKERRIQRRGDDKASSDAFKRECCELFERICAGSSGPRAQQAEVLPVSFAATTADGDAGDAGGDQHLWATQVLKQELDSQSASSSSSVTVHAGRHGRVSAVDDRVKASATCYAASRCLDPTPLSRMVVAVSSYSLRSTLAAPRSCPASNAAAGESSQDDTGAAMDTLVARAWASLGQKPASRVNSSSLKQQEIHAAASDSVASVLEKLYCLHENCQSSSGALGSPGLGLGVTDTVHLPSFFHTEGQHYVHTPTSVTAVAAAAAAAAVSSNVSPPVGRIVRSKRCRQTKKRATATAAPTHTPTAVPEIPYPDKYVAAEEHVPSGWNIDTNTEPYPNQSIDMSDVPNVPCLPRNQRKVYSKRDLVMIRGYANQLKIRLARWKPPISRKSNSSANSINLTPNVDAGPQFTATGFSLSSSPAAPVAPAAHVVGPIVYESQNQIQSTSHLRLLDVLTNSQDRNIIGKPHLYFHNVTLDLTTNMYRCCVHVVVLSDVVAGSWKPNSPETTFLSAFVIRKCDICNLHMATLITYGDRLCSTNPTLFCDVCFHMLHYTKMSPNVMNDDQQARESVGPSLKPGIELGSSSPSSSSASSCTGTHADGYHLLYDDFSVYSYQHDMK